MYLGKTVAVVVPAYNEEKQIRQVIETMPEFVDRIVVVNDGSGDNTGQVVLDCIKKDNCIRSIEKRNEIIIDDSPYNSAIKVMMDIKKQELDHFPDSSVYNDNPNDRIVLINQTNSGVGGAISTGYRWCRDNNIFCTAVMAGDGQMDPAELESIITPVIVEGVDYVKGNRLIHASAAIMIPRIRFFGNSVLSLLTKIASGYWNITDTQTGYTAISIDALDRLPIHNLYKSYGCPNDLLVKLNMSYCTLKEIPIKPVYNIGEKSKMNIRKVIPKVSMLLLKDFFQRIVGKYFLKDFHPIFLFYFLGIGLTILNIPLLVYILYNVFILNGTVPTGVYITFLLFTLFSFQSLGFAMWMDIQDNQRLYK